MLIFLLSLAERTIHRYIYTSLTSQTYISTQGYIYIYLTIQIYITIRPDKNLLVSENLIFLLPLYFILNIHISHILQKQLGYYMIISLNSAEHVCNSPTIKNEFVRFNIKNTMYMIYNVYGVSQSKPCTIIQYILRFVIWKIRLNTKVQRQLKSS